MTIAGEYGIPPAILAEVQQYARISEEVLAAARPLMEAAGPVLDIISRQRTAMAEIQRRSELAVRARQELASFLHSIPDASLAAISPVTPVATQVALLGLLPQTPEEAEEVRQGVEEIRSDPELSSKIKRIASGINWPDLRKLPAWAVLFLVAQRLFQAAELPVTTHLDADQLAVLQNKFMVLAVIAALAQIIISWPQD